MKKLLTICLLLVTTFTVKAQNMSFEETVKYIKDKIACCSEGRDLTLTVKKDGTIQLWGNTYNIFEFVEIKHSWDISSSNGIRLSYGPGPGLYFIKFNLSSNTDNALIFSKFQSKIDGERVYKALQHLHSLCTKSKDPFDN